MQEPILTPISEELRASLLPNELYAMVSVGTSQDAVLASVQPGMDIELSHRRIAADVTFFVDELRGELAEPASFPGDALARGQRAFVAHWPLTSSQRRPCPFQRSRRRQRP